MTGRLAGWRVLVTRQPEQSRELVEALEAEGAQVVEVPLVATGPPADTGPLDAAVARLEAYDWVAFTSANAVRAVADALVRTGRAPALPEALRVASVGPATAEAVVQAWPGSAVALSPARDFRAEGLAEAFESAGVGGRRILLPQSALARDVLEGALRAQGAEVDAVVAYRTVTPPDAADRIRAEIGRGIDAVTFASPSAVNGFVDACPDRLAWPPAVVIGPVTEAAARAQGLDVRAVALAAGARGLADALCTLTRHR